MEHKLPQQHLWGSRIGSLRHERTGCNALKMSKQDQQFLCMLERERMKLASLLLREDGSVLSVYTHGFVCVSGRKTKEYVITVKVYHHRREVPSPICVGICIKSGNVGHHGAKGSSRNIFLSHLSHLDSITICLLFSHLNLSWKCWALCVCMTLIHTLIKAEQSKRSGLPLIDINVYLGNPKPAERPGSWKSIAGTQTGTCGDL